MTSLWLDTAPHIEADPFRADVHYDEIIVGAGLTGLVTALMLAESGRSVAVLEARYIGAGATGNSTAKLSLLQGTHLSSIRRTMYQSVVQAYVDEGRAASEWLLAYLESRDIAVETRDAVTYAGRPDAVAAVDREFEVARSVGLAVERRDDTDLPFRTYGSVVLPDQAQFDPMLVLAALAADVRRLGGVIHERSRMTGLTASDPVRVRTAEGDLTADRVVLATGVPVLDRGLYFAKLSAQRSYALAFDLDAAQAPDGMFLSAESPTRSIRSHGSTLLTGGNGHGVGRHPSPQTAVDELVDWTLERWPGARLTHTWSAQDYAAPHHLPFVGALPRGRGRVFFASGFEKWGMTNAVAAAMTLHADLLGGQTAAMKVLRRRVTTPLAIATGVGENAAVATWYARSWWRALSTSRPEAPPAEGQGVMAHDGARPVGVSTVNGVTCAVSGMCTHLGAALTWNDAEKSWDCPAHGSRFSARGAVLEGPARRALGIVG